jgi:hypothetical protein
MPVSMHLKSSRCIGKKRVHIASMQKTPAALAAFGKSALASSAVIVKGFSIKTCLPARIAVQSILEVRLVCGDHINRVNSWVIC